MNKRQKKGISARELLDQLQKDPSYAKMLEEKEKKKEQNAEEYFIAAKPIFESLADEGLHLTPNNALSREVLALSRGDFTKAIPILLEWLSRVDLSALREDIVRTFAVPWTDPNIAPELIRIIDLETEDSSFSWAIANTLEVIADETIQEDLIRLISKDELGSTRQMLVLALGNINNESSINTLVSLLPDHDLIGHAIMALGKIYPPNLEEIISPYKDHEREWIRAEVQKILST